MACLAHCWKIVMHICVHILILWWSSSIFFLYIFTHLKGIGESRAHCHCESSFVTLFTLYSLVCDILLEAICYLSNHILCLPILLSHLFLFNFILSLYYPTIFLCLYATSLRCLRIRPYVIASVEHSTAVFWMYLPNSVLWVQEWSTALV